MLVLMANLHVYFHCVTADQLDQHASCSLTYCLLWSLPGYTKLKSRQDLGNVLRNVTTISLSSASTMQSLIMRFVVNCCFAVHV